MLISFYFDMFLTDVSCLFQRCNQEKDLDDLINRREEVPSSRDKIRIVCGGVTNLRTIFKMIHDF